jgi:hypothetical protein
MDILLILLASLIGAEYGAVVPLWVWLGAGWLTLYLAVRSDRKRAEEAKRARIEAAASRRLIREQAAERARRNGLA